MMQPGEIRQGNGQLDFSLAVLEAAQLQRKMKRVRVNLTPSRASNVINLSGSQVLVWSLSALCGIGLLLWAIIRLWLFE